MRTPREPGIWFPAKSYGWGWGLPVVWQGWAVLVGWIALLCAGTVWTLEYPNLRAIFVIVMLVAFFAVCWAKGERPRARWGRDEK